MKPTIDDILEEFVHDQRARLATRTLAQYTYALSYFRHCLEAYWPGHGQEEYNRITEAGGTYCGTFGPEELPGAYGEFLGYYMPRKAMCGKQTMRAAATVTKKLAIWLREKGYVADVDLAVKRASDAARELPASKDALRILEAHAARYTPDERSHRIEDHFRVVRLEPGKLWLDPGSYGDEALGPVPVPRQATARLKVGWDIGGVVERTSRGLRLVEVWNISP
jgi:hypothetical protein